MDDQAAQDRSELVELTAEIVSAFVSNNSVGANEIPSLIGDVHDALSRASSKSEQPAREELRPAIPIKKSVTPDYIICLEDGKKIQTTQAPSSHALRPFTRRVP